MIKLSYFLDYCILNDLMPKEFPPGASPLEVHMEMGLYVSMLLPFFISVISNFDPVYPDSLATHNLNENPE